MQKISYSEPYGMQQAVFDGYKTMTRREPIFEGIENPWTGFDTKGHLCLYDGDMLVHVSRYALNEEVAISQRYSDIANDPYFKDQCAADELSLIWDFATSKGWSNKLFSKAWLLPRRQIITDIKAERLQEISEEDCMKEGIVATHGGYGIEFGESYNVLAQSPREAFAALIDKISDKETWERNPWIIAYNFKLVK